MQKARGFTLIELLVVLVIVGLLVAMAAGVTRALTSQQRRSVVSTRLATVDAALVQYVMQRKRLPCPANGSLASADPNAGRETAHDDTIGCTTNEANGVVPWFELGITEADATDGWDRRLTYRVQPVLAAKNGMDMSWCDPAGSAAVISPPSQAANVCNTACVNSNVTTLQNSCTPPVSFLSGGIAPGRGLIVQSVLSSPLMTPPSTGAAYVLISHGESGGGGYLNTGQLSTSSTTDGTEEQKNYASAPLVAGTYYVDDGISDGPGASHFDDIVSRPSVLTVASKAGIGPRSHQ